MCATQSARREALTTLGTRTLVGMLETARRSVAEAFAGAVALLLPTSCAGCDTPDRPLCPTCLAALTPEVRRWQIAPEQAGPGAPLTVWSGLDYEGVVRRVVAAYKDAGRTDVAKPLARALRAAVLTCLERIEPALSQPADGPAGGVELLTIPSSRAARRRRGYLPVDLLLERAGFAPARVLRHVRQPGDQAALGVGERWKNLSGSLVATRELSARSFIIVDDIVTTGATLWEARRAITADGGRVVGAATVAHTARLFPSQSARR